MKRLILALAATAALAAPMAASAQSWRDHDHDRGHDQRHDRGDHNRGGYDRGGYDRNRGGGDWDRGRHNGYYYNNRFYYGPPPSSYYGRPGYRPGYESWRRGGYLPSYYNGYVVNDYYRYHLRPPPRGYHWVRAGNDYILAAIATGLIFDVIAGGY